MVLGVGDCGLIVMDSARSIESGMEFIGYSNLCSADVGNLGKKFGLD